MYDKLNLNAIDIAKYIINKCNVENNPISNLQLQKILYYIQRDFLKKYNIILFNDSIEAWRFGPVVPEVYYNFCGFGSMKIRSIYPESENIQLSSEYKNTINMIVNQKRQLDPWTLVEETHAKDKAWDITYQDGMGENDIIEIGLIATHG